VLLLGDSFVEAKQVPEEQGVSSRLATLLNGPGRPPVEILNSGVSGWGPANEYLYLRTEGLAFEPDLVIVSFYVGNDISNNYPRSEREQRSLHEPAFSLTADGQLEQLAWTPRSVREGDASDALREHSLLFRAFETGVLDKLRYPLAGSDVEVNPRRLAIYQTRESPALSAAWQIVDALLGAIQAEVDRAGARMMLVIVPSKWQVHREDWQAFLKQNNLQQDDSWDLDRPNKRLMKIAERRGIPTLDLLPTLRAAASDGTRLYFPIDIHFTAEGHAVAARAMSEYIQAAGLPPVSGSAQR